MKDGGPIKCSLVKILTLATTKDGQTRAIAGVKTRTAGLTNLATGKTKAVGLTTAAPGVKVVDPGVRAEVNPTEVNLPVFLLVAATVIRPEVVAVEDANAARRTHVHRDHQDRLATKDPMAIQESQESPAYPE